MFLTLPYPICERVIAVNDASWAVSCPSYNILHLEKSLVKVSVGHLNVGKQPDSVPAKQSVWCLLNFWLLYSALS